MTENEFMYGFFVGQVVLLLGIFLLLKHLVFTSSRKFTQSPTKITLQHRRTDTEEEVGLNQLLKLLYTDTLIDSTVKQVTDHINATLLKELNLRIHQVELGANPPRIALERLVDSVGIVIEWINPAKIGLEGAPSYFGICLPVQATLLINKVECNLSLMKNLQLTFTKAPRVELSAKSSFGAVVMFKDDFGGRSESLVRSLVDSKLAALKGVVFDLEKYLSK